MLDFLRRLVHVLAMPLRTRAQPFMLADPMRSTFASATAALQFFSMSCLTPWVARVEKAFAASVLGPKHRLHLDLSSILRADPESVAKTALQYRLGGIIAPNEARSDLGLLAHPDGNSIAPLLQGVGENEAVAKPLAPTHHPAGDDSPSGDKARKLNGHARHT